MSSEQLLAAAQASLMPSFVQQAAPGACAAAPEPPGLCQTRQQQQLEWVQPLGLQLQPPMWSRCWGGQQQHLHLPVSQDWAGAAAVDLQGNCVTCCLLLSDRNAVQAAKGLLLSGG